MSAASPVRHLIVLCHGLHGSASDLKILCTKLQEKLGSDAYVHATSKNEERFLISHDGIDTGGNRVAEEVVEIAAKFPQLSQFSIVGHSLGGLYSRYCVGRLHEMGFFEKVSPINYVSLSSPHLGSRRSYLGARVSSLFQWAAPKVLARTGQQLMLDDDATNPLLLKMTEPEGHFFQALSKFKRVVLYSVVEGDTKVQYCTAAILPRNPYSLKQRIPVVMEKYPHVVDPVASLKVAEETEKILEGDADTAQTSTDLKISPAAQEAAVEEMVKPAEVSEFESAAQGDVLASQLSGKKKDETTDTNLAAETKETMEAKEAEAEKKSEEPHRGLLGWAWTPKLPGNFSELAKQKVTGFVSSTTQFVLKTFSSGTSLEATSTDNSSSNSNGNGEKEPFASDSKKDVLVAMLNNMHRLKNLERVDVCFDGRLKMMSAHEDIVMRRESNCGIDIVQHLVDHFQHSPQSS